MMPNFKSRSKRFKEKRRSKEVSIENSVRKSLKRLECKKLRDYFRLGEIDQVDFESLKLIYFHIEVIADEKT